MSFSIGIHRFTLHRAASSFSIWMVLSVTFAWIGLSSFRPLRSVPHDVIPPGMLARSAIQFKMRRYENLPAPPDVVILGSSLPMCAFYYPEDDYFERSLIPVTEAEGLNLIQSYTAANRFTSMLKSKTGKEPRVFNLTGAACMVSDVNLMLSRALKTGRKPKTIIYGLGLRDFVDNINPPIGQTPTYLALCDIPQLVSQRSLLASSNFSSLLLSAVVPFYRDRDEYRLWLEQWLCAAFNRQTNLQIVYRMIQAGKPGAVQSAMKNGVSDKSHVPGGSNSHGIEAESRVTKIASDNSTMVQPTNRAGARTHEVRPNDSTLEATTVSPRKAPDPIASNASAGDTHGLAALDYARRYNPPNLAQFDLEASQLESVMVTCEKEGITLILINMPVSSSHKSLSPHWLRQAYLERLKSVAFKHKVELIDFEGANDFQATDFLDTVHLSASGGLKFLRALVDAIAPRFGNADSADTVGGPTSDLSP